jgi:hypothetical protein
MERPQVADGGDALQFGRAAANMLNKQWGPRAGMEVMKKKEKYIFSLPGIESRLLGRSARSYTD